MPALDFPERTKQNMTSLEDAKFLVEVAQAYIDKTECSLSPEAKAINSMYRGLIVNLRSLVSKMEAEHDKIH